MATKKKSKKKVVKKSKSVVVANQNTAILVKKLKSSKIYKSAIARACGLKSHNTVNYWFKKKGVPLQYVTKLEKLLGV